MKKKFVRRETPLRAIRIQTGKTQAMVADELGMKKSTYSAWETGRIQLTTDHILMLSEYFSCTPNDIVGYRDENDETGASVIFSNLSEEERLFLSLYNMLPPNIKSSILDIMRSCTKAKRPRMQGGML